MGITETEKFLKCLDAMAQINNGAFPMVEVARKGNKVFDEIAIDEDGREHKLDCYTDLLIINTSVYNIASNSVDYCLNMVINYKLGKMSTGYIGELIYE